MPLENVIEPPKAKLNPALKLTLELGPIVLYFAVYRLYGLLPATATMMLTVLVTLGVSWAMLRRLPIMPLVTAAIVLVFGGAALITGDKTFAKVKLTVLYATFSAALFYGLWFGKPILKVVFDEALHLTEEGWRSLTWRWAFFFAALAVVNEIVWRSVDEATWVNFKTFGIMPLTFLFMLAQTPLITRTMIEEAQDGDAF
jgi:intracellular septation protein